MSQSSNISLQVAVEQLAERRSQENLDLARQVTAAKVEAQRMADLLQIVRDQISDAVNSVSAPANCFSASLELLGMLNRSGFYRSSTSTAPMP